MEVTNPFEIKGEAKRYDQYRPQYHSIPFGLIEEYAGSKFEKALDVACGTGHSTEALAKISKTTIGCDLSAEMLEQAAKRPNIEFIKSAAESLPFADNEFDIVNISMGFHWLDQGVFLDEAKRVLTSDGLLCVDSYGFSGKISDDSNKQSLHNKFFEENLPAASRRNAYPSDELVKERSMELVKEFVYGHTLELSAEEFMNLIMTWSNFQIKSDEQKAEIFERMKLTYQEIFEGHKLPLEFRGKAVLYRFS